MFRTGLLLLGVTASIVGQPMAATSCHSITLTGELHAGDHFERVIGGELVFRLEPERLGPDGEFHGWRISLTPLHEPDRDYIYPVTPPLRFNGLQILGPSYGDDTKTSLTHPHEMRFLLGRADYDRISPLLTDALWPYSAPPSRQGRRRIHQRAQNVDYGSIEVHRAVLRCRSCERLNPTDQLPGRVHDPGEL